MKVFDRSGEVNRSVIDALGELGNIGVGTATTALGKILGERIVLKQPQVYKAEGNIASLLSDDDESNVVMGIVMTMELKPSGMAVFILNKDIMENIIFKLTKKHYKPDEMLEDEYCLSAIQEIANTVASAYMTAIGTYTGLRLYLKPVMVGFDRVSDIINESVAEMNVNLDKAVCIKTSFDFLNKNAQNGGYVIIMPDNESLEKIVELIM